jgi:hypothetical protein
MTTLIALAAGFAVGLVVGFCWRMWAGPVRVITLPNRANYQPAPKMPQNGRDPRPLKRPASLRWPNAEGWMLTHQGKGRART